MKEVIKCCPFCGSREVAVARTNKNACWIECANCGANSESAKTRTKAIANWNRREYYPFAAQIVEDMDMEYGGKR